MLIALPSTGPFPYDHPTRVNNRASLAARMAGRPTSLIEEVLTDLLADPLNDTDRDRAMVADEIDAMASVLQDRADRSIDLP